MQCSEQIHWILHGNRLKYLNLPFLTEINWRRDNKVPPRNLINYTFGNILPCLMHICLIERRKLKCLRRRIMHVQYSYLPIKNSSCIFFANKGSKLAARFWIESDNIPNKRLSVHSNYRSQLLFNMEESHRRGLHMHFNFHRSYAIDSVAI